MQSIGSTTPQTLTIGNATVVDPPWIEGGEVVWAAAIERDTPALAILRVERALGPKSAPPSEVARLALPFLPALSVAALTRAPDAGARIVTASPVGPDLAFTLLEFRAPGSLRATATHPIPAVGLHPDSRPACMVDDTGSVHLWVIVLRQGQADRPALLHVVFPAQPHGQPTGTLRPVSVASPVQWAQAGAFMADGSRTSAVLSLVDGSAIYVRDDGTTAPVHFPSPNRPRLLVTADNSYLVTHEAGTFSVRSLDE